MQIQSQKEAIYKDPINILKVKNHLEIQWLAKNSRKASRKWSTMNSENLTIQTISKKVEIRNSIGVINHPTIISENPIIPVIFNKVEELITNQPLKTNKISRNQDIH